MGLLYTLSNLRPRYLFPSMEVDSIADIDFQSLKNTDTRGVIIDFDNTLGLYGSTVVDERVEDAFNELVSTLPAVILSNTDNERRSRLKQYFTVPVVSTDIRKPRVEPFYEALDILGTDAHHTVVIGDRLLTDIAGGNKIGAYTIKVKPLDWRSEPFSHSVVRGLETFVYRFMKE